MNKLITPPFFGRHYISVKLVYLIFFKEINNLVLQGCIKLIKSDSKNIYVT